MEAIKSYFYKRYVDNDNVTSLIVVSSMQKYSPIIDGFDVLILVIATTRQPTNFISHYIKENLSIQERWIHVGGLENWILNGENRNIISWLIQGEILMDKNKYLYELKKKLEDFPKMLRERKLFIEFSLFLRVYMQAKAYNQEGQTLDAYSKTLEALHHWARIAIIEVGLHPEVMVWHQVKKINTAVYKLYEELTLSLETLEERVNLVLLACEFSLMSKMKDCSAILFKVLESRDEPWSADELKYHPELVDLHIELSLVLNKLLKRGLIKEVAVVLEKDLSLLELRYTN